MLTVRSHMALTLAARHLPAAVTATLAHDTLGMSDTRHAQVVLALLDDPDALAAHPALVHRLRRLRDERRAVRRRVA